MLLRFTILLLVLATEARQVDHHKHSHHKKKDHHNLHKDHHDPHHSKHDRDQKKMMLNPDEHEVHMKKISWLNVPEVTGCQCKHKGEMCIEGPDKQPTCVQKHHLKESARLFKHYHENKERAEVLLNEVDPKRRRLNNIPFDAPHDVHISMESQHNKLRKQDYRLDETDPHGHKPKEGKHERERKLTRLPHIQEASSNFVLNQKKVDTAPSAKCEATALNEMRKRLTGWFHLLHGKEHHHHSDHDHHHKSRKHLSVKKELRGKDDESECECLKSVMWEFRQMDTDYDHILNKTELKVIDNNDMEPCLHPYLMSCDANSDGLLSHKEWCCCFPQKEAESPCYAKLIEIETTKTTEEFIPSCDHEGYYKKEQCMGNILNNQSCWCVTPTGSEIPGSRVYGRAHCEKLDNMGYPKRLM